LWAQLEQLEDIPGKGIRIWNIYDGILRGNVEQYGIQLPDIPDYATNNGHMYYLVCQSLEQRTRLMAALKEQGIQTTFHYLPLHSSVYYKDQFHGAPLTNCDRYGGLYQWAEMMQLPSECNQENCRNQYDTVTYHHQGICPDGWRLLTYNDFYIVVHADGNTHGVEGTRSAYGFGGYNTTGYSLVGAGYNWNGSFKGINDETYWHYPEENPENYAEKSKASYQYTLATGNPISNTFKTHGFSVRCVMDE